MGGYGAMHPLMQPSLPQSSPRTPLLPQGLPTQGLQVGDASHPASAHAHVHLSPGPAPRRGAPLGAPPLPPTPFAHMPAQGAPPRPTPDSLGDGLQNTTFARSALGTASIGAASIDAAEQLSSGEQLLARDLALLLNDDFDM